jgi:glycosyltransferase involved in cell wall biosynthesis
VTRSQSIPVAVVTRKLDVGGTECHLVQTLPRLSRSHFDVRVFTLYGAGVLDDELRARGIPVKGPPTGLPSWIRVPIVVLRLAAHVLHRRPIVHFFLPEAYLMGGLVGLMTGQRRMIMSRRSLNFYQREHRLSGWLERRLHSKMRAVLGSSGAVAADLVSEGVSSERVRVLYNGVDALVFENARPRPEVRASLGSDQETLILIIVANLIPYKGHRDLLDALARIKGNLPSEWILLCVGRDHATQGALQAQAEASGIDQHIRFLGERSDVPDLLKASDIGVLCSHFEGFPNAVLEGMAARLPMVVTDVGGCGEAIVNEVCGLVVPPREPEALAKALHRLAANPNLRMQLGTAASERVRRRFSMKVCVSAYERIYEAVWQGRSLPPLSWGSAQDEVL